MRHISEVRIRTAADVLGVWQELMGPGGFGGRTLWLLFLDRDGVPAQVLMPIEELEPEPDDRFVDALAKSVSHLRADGLVHTVVLLLSRPGPGQMTDQDRRWACALGARPALAGWPIHLATADRVQVFAGDDLITARTG